MQNLKRIRSVIIPSPLYNIHNIPHVPERPTFKLPHLLPLLKDCLGNFLINFSTLAAREKFTAKISL